MRRPPYLPAEAEPFNMINTTPMIDVMLVILIILMLSLPAPTHKVPIELPGAGPAGAVPPSHRLSIATDGSYRLDGIPRAASEVRQQLAQFAVDPARPVLEVDTDRSAPYVRFDEAMAMVKHAGIGRIGFVGNPTGF